MLDKAKNANDIVYAVAKRARELGELNKRELCIEAGYDCVTQGEAYATNRYFTKGELIEIVLTEEFIEDCPRELED